MRAFAFLCLLLSGLPALAGPPESRLDYYCESYGACQEKFLKQAGETIAGLPPGQREAAQIGRWGVPSQTDPSLGIDYMYVPPTGAPKDLIVITSGVHGVEGYAGSAVQQLFMKEIFSKVDRAHTGVMIVHGVNPYGFKHDRRATENNVDLNRNLDTTPTLFSNENEGYRTLDHFLNPTLPVKGGAWDKINFWTKMVKIFMKEPLSKLRQAVIGGQYQFPRGFYYGGNAPEPQTDIMRDKFLPFTKPYGKILLMDVHTGYGQRGTLHMFPSEKYDDRTEEAVAHVFGEAAKTALTAQNAYTNAGEFNGYLVKMISAEGKLAVPMTLEYGTINNEGHLGGIDSIRRIMRENQLHFYGAESSGVAKAVKKTFREMFFPSARSWREKILADTAVQMPNFIRRFQGLPMVCPMGELK